MRSLVDIKKSFFGKGLFATIIVPLILGTCGYILIEGWNVLDGFYMSIITLSTVGYGETQELSQSGRVFTTILIVISMLSMAWWTAAITTIFVGGELTGAFRKQKEAKMISRLANHVVVCGGGLMAQTIIDQLHRSGKTVVAIIGSQDEITLMQRLYPQLLIVHGEPKSELALADANAIAAKYLIAAVESDYDNLLITITGKGMGTDIKIISCAHGNELASRMLKVGADQVICPLVLGGEEAARLIV